MKNTLMIPLVFTGHLILLTVFLSVFSVPASYTTLMALSSGNAAFFISELVSSCLYLFPLAVMLSVLYLFFYPMRHKTILYISIPLVLLLVALSVVYLIPVSYRASARYMAASAIASDESSADLDTLSPGMYSKRLIRSDSDGKRIIWLDNDSSRLVARGILVADTTVGSGTPGLSVYPEANYNPDTKQLLDGMAVLFSPAGGSDPLIAEKLEAPGFLVRLVRDIRLVLASFRAAAVNGPFSYYAIVGSFFALVCSLWVICYASRWWLLNVLMIFTLFRGILMGYSWTTGGIVFDIARKVLPQSVSPDMVSPFLFLACTFLILLAALAVFIGRKAGHSGSEAYYD